jgi:4-alpha-glucanotransferase
MRLSGILMPIFSLSSSHGIGTFGKEAYRFVDFLKKAGQTYWQILPLNPTNCGNSPYQSFSSAAGNPYFIDLDILKEDGLLSQNDLKDVFFGDDFEKVDYEAVGESRKSLLKKAYNNFSDKDGAFASFKDEESEWLLPYSLFMALKDLYNGADFKNWPHEIKFKDENAIDEKKEELKEEIEYYSFQQFLFYSQWASLKKYANENGVKIIGDMPIYVAEDSADVWYFPENFQLDKNLTLKSVAGVPPDAFSKEGQRWGMPLYNWSYMQKEETPYSFWVKRLKNAFSLYDVVRIDHFRGFESYYSIPASSPDAKKGSWKKGPGMKLFKELKKHFDTLPIIAEDLGFLTPAVKKLLKDSGFPGMKILQFAFDSREENDYLPHNYPKNSVVYTGTHDNDTILGWAKNVSKEEVEFAEKYMNSKDPIHWAMMKTAFSSVADTAILMMPDIIGLGSEGRINTPSTLTGNWEWRIKGECINDWLASVLLEITEIYGRIAKK